MIKKPQQPIERCFFVSYWYTNNNGFNKSMGYITFIHNKYPTYSDIKGSIIKCFGGEKETLIIIPVHINEINIQDFKDFNSDDVNNMESNND